MFSSTFATNRMFIECNIRVYFLSFLTAHRCNIEIKDTIVDDTTRLDNISNLIIQFKVTT